MSTVDNSPAVTPATPVSDSSPATPSSDAAAPAAVANSAFARALEEDGYFIDLGPGLTISAQQMSAQVNLQDRPQPLPGLLLRELQFNARRQTATLLADVTVPHLQSPPRGLRITIDNEGRPTLDIELRSDLALFNNKTLRISLDEQRNLTATLEIAPADLMPRRPALPNLSISGGGTFVLANGKLSGNVSAQLNYASLGSGQVNFAFTPAGQASGDGEFQFEPGYLHGAVVSLAIDEQANLTADVSIPLSDIQTPVPGLSLSEGSILFSLNNTVPGGALQGVKLSYAGLADITVNATIRQGRFSGSASFNASIAELADASGNARYQNGLLTGSLTISPRHFPSALPVTAGSITATLTETSDLDLAGEATIELGPAGNGQLRASRVNGVIVIGTDIQLENIPGLQSSSIHLEFSSEGTVTGSADVATDDSLLPGLTGTVHVEYRDNLWSGESEISYSREQPNVSGSVTVNVRQTEDNTLVFSGAGELTAQIIPGVEGMAGVLIDEEGNVVLNFAISQTEPYELFAEQRREREFVNISRNIPLWAGIVVAVIRIRAGARAGVGPGQIRNSRIEGSWEISSDEAPDISISSEFYMPAFVEGYVAFGAGLGVDVLLGSLTGGIEAMAVAGLYGAVSVVPELSYQDGDWLFDGTATLAAGARLKLSLNAWAEIEALWVTVWERNWELASHTMPLGPDLVLRANVAMNLSNPTVPELTFEASDTDNEGLIDSAMPEDGPPAAGTREALENRAEWSGRSRDSGADADTVPDELASQASEEVEAPAAPPQPAASDGPPAAAAAAAPTDTPAVTASTDADSASSEHQPVVSASELPTTTAPRYANPISLDTLIEAPVPMPRTAEQEREDLRVAAQVLDLALAQTQDSEQLMAYFPRLVRRFQLTFAGFVQQGDDTSIRLAINPELTVHDDTTVAKGRGIAGMQTEIIYSSGSLTGSGDTVGIRMHAPVLGPDHPSGSGPRGQSDLMSRLQTDAGGDDERYVKGHLLNDQVGGIGLPHNLFPITGRANGEHEATVERRVKAWIERGYWMTYTVEVELLDADITDVNTADSNFVMARFNISGDVIDLDKQPSGTNSIDTHIDSPLGAPRTRTSRTVVDPVDTASQPLAVRPEDAAAEQELSTRHGGVYLDYHLKVALDSALQLKGRPAVESALQSAGLSASRIVVLFLAYGYSQGPQRNIAALLTETSQRSALTTINDMAATLIAALNA